MDDITKPTATAKPVDYENLEFHPLANMFPLIEGDEFDAFVEAFRRQGLLNSQVEKQVGQTGRIR
jgi:hypothetical protein